MKTGLRTLAAAVGWFAVVLQYWLVITGDAGADPINRTLNFFSYFTILTNILAATAMTVSVIAPGSRLDHPGVRTAIATYIIIVGVVYHLLLRDTWEPQRWQWLADMILHYVTPTLFVLDWIVFVPKGAVPWRTAVLALVYPVVYMGWTLWHGSWSGFYPYPFVDVPKLGLQQVLNNGGRMALSFLAIGLLLIGAGRLLDRLQIRRLPAA